MPSKPFAIWAKLAVHRPMQYTSRQDIVLLYAHDACLPLHSSESGERAALGEGELVEPFAHAHVTVAIGVQGVRQVVEIGIAEQLEAIEVV